MTSVLRLATLSYAVACVDAGFSIRAGRHAKDWGPPTETLGNTQIDPAGWTPKPTAPPGARPEDWELRRRQQGVPMTDTCGFPVSKSNDPAIGCSDGAFCASSSGVVGCCSARDRRDCTILPTACVEVGTPPTRQPIDPQTLTCSDQARPRCVTYLYNVNFFEYLHGYSFLACGGEAGNSMIATSPFPGWSPTSRISTATPLATNPVTVTISPGVEASSTADYTSSTSHVGAIVGGVIGGVAGLALLIAGILLFLRYRRRREGEERVGDKGVGNSPPYPSQDFTPAGVYPSGLPDFENPSFYYGEIPPQMVHTPHPDAAAYPTAPQPPQPPPTSYNPANAPRNVRPPEIPSTFVPVARKPPTQDDIVSPISPQPYGELVSPADDPTTYTWISNPTPPPQSEYSQFSPPSPPQFQSYRPYHRT
ncbi:hypothetical protein GGS23DRAFT_319157 [Durotheca rogersii]|uniref:uncharacterized protein n=1 Tax=Durotheca rogersii TaxID=419775 RepID=UPI0022203C85|nr:uncharacterized protein GGS23DRAFT_319157 [Durotheca rogersii]KAI5859471.1 hypothetical protein GGS23DRAFT_319157 [Durotheca rogersii]